MKQLDLRTVFYRIRMIELILYFLFLSTIGGACGDICFSLRRRRKSAYFSATSLFPASLLPSLQHVDYVKPAPSLYRLTGFFRYANHTLIGNLSPEVLLIP
jgi:hypothetical protein